MIFKRILTPPELKLLGDSPKQKIHDIIDAALKRMTRSHNSGTVESRIKTLLTKTKPMNAREITDAHNALFGNNAITIAYVRFSLTGMFQAGMIKRESRGKYILS